MLQTCEFQTINFVRSNKLRLKYQPCRNLFYNINVLLMSIYVFDEKKQQFFKRKVAANSKIRISLFFKSLSIKDCSQIMQHYFLQITKIRSLPLIHSCFPYHGQSGKHKSPPSAHAQDYPANKQKCFFLYFFSNQRRSLGGAFPD